MAHRPAGWSSGLDACPSMLRRPCGRAMRSKGRVDVDAVASKPGVAKKCCRSRDGSYAYVCSKGGSGVNTTLRRTHELKSGDRRRPETERQGLAPRPSHDSRVASREFVTHRVRYTGTARPNPIIGTPGVVTCASSLRCELHSRLQSPQVTTEDCPKTLLRDSSTQRPG